MKTQKNFIFKIVEGKPTFTSDHQKALYKQFLGQFEGKKVWITIDPRLPTRSSRQNRYYWLYLGVIATETGHSPGEIHEWAKGKFLTSTIKEILGDKVRVKKSTTELNKSDFVEYIMKIEGETGVPSPDIESFEL